MFCYRVVDDLFEACKEATVHATRNWAVLQDRDAFDEWLITRVR